MILILICRNRIKVIPIIIFTFLSAVYDRGKRFYDHSTRFVVRALVICIISYLMGGNFLINLVRNAAVYIGLDGSVLSPNATIVVSGRIKVTRAGFPCIILGNNQNNRVTLKDLVLINDGTVSPIMINSSTPENVTIQNVTSNSLISDPNIIETGQSIIRNSNYK